MNLTLWLRESWAWPLAILTVIQCVAPSGHQLSLGQRGQQWNAYSIPAHIARLTISARVLDRGVSPWAEGEAGLVLRSC